MSSNNLESKLLSDAVHDPAVVSVTLLESHDDPRFWDDRPIEEIHARAEAMTELLKGILESHRETHWGINE